MAYITRAASPINGITFETAEAAIAAFCAPAYAGAPAKTVEVTGPNTFIWMGDRYTVESGENPRDARRAARAATRKQDSRTAFDTRGSFRGSRWLSREMDRADSDF